MRIIAPHKGAQTRFLSTPADIAIYGGQAGGGKSYGLILDASRHIHVPNYNAILFRRTTPQIRRAGGLWDTSEMVYPYLNGHPSNQILRWTFPSTATIDMTHIEYEKNLRDHDGSQYAYIGWDELIHFPGKFFWYLFSRNRSVCGVRPVIRAATNPTPLSDPTGGWVRELVDWYISNEERSEIYGTPKGYAIPQRSGVVRYFTRDERSGEIIWVSKDWRSPEGDPPISFTFIPGKLEDNMTLMRKDRKYRQSLMMLDEVERKRLKDGNWDAEYEGGLFKAEDLIIVDEVPKGMHIIRYWDLAGTTPSPRNPEPDFTSGGLVGWKDGRMYILDIDEFQGSPGDVEDRIKANAERDSAGIEIYMEQEPGSAGKHTIYQYATKILQGYAVYGDRPDADKVLRAKPWCALSQHKCVFLLRGAWNRKFINQATSFPFGKKDMVDCISGAYKILSGRPNIDPNVPFSINIPKISVLSGLE
jgi:phage terminase large subunit-like protein